MKIYFAGSIRGGRDDTKKYQFIISELQKYGEVLTEHIGLDSLTAEGQKEFTEQKIYKQDTDWIKMSDIIIAEVTQPSLGVGYELGFGEAHKKRVVCLYNSDSNNSLSAMIKGNDYFEIVNYTSEHDIQNILRAIFKD